MAQYAPFSRRVPVKNNEDWHDPPFEQPDLFDLGNWLGRWQAFGFVGARCSAANIECLREIRDKKLYKPRSRTWARFCTRYLGMSRAQIDRFLQCLAEFGPNYFHLTQIVRVSPRTYRAISPALLEDGILLHKAPIPLTPENAGLILRAVRQLRREAATHARVSLPAPPVSWKPGHSAALDPKMLHERLTRLATRLDALVRAFAALPTLGLDPQNETMVIQALDRAIGQLAALRRALR